MKKKLLQLFTVCVALLLYNTTKAQTYEQLQVTSGFTEDVIANGTGSAINSSTAGIDNANICFMSDDFQPTAAAPPAYALPASGLITSATTTGLTFQLGPLSGDNSLRIQDQNDSGTLVFSNGVQASGLHILATSGNGDATITATITFTDATTQVVTGGIIPDWFFSDALPVAISGIGRVYRNTDVIENPDGNPRIYQYTVEILPANQIKTVASIGFTKTSSEDGTLNVFAVTAELTGTCLSPGELTAVATANAATLSWMHAVISPAGGYDYYYSTSNVPPTETTEPSGNVDSSTNSVNLSGLNTGIPYYAWVRSNCSATDKGPWVMVSFTPGQVSVTYTLGDIPTLFSSDEPTTTSATTCVGTMTVPVPSGYQVSSVATSYIMSTASNGWISEQRSLLTCTSMGTTETAVSAGTGNVTGSQNYDRTGLDFADGATGDVVFELRAWRTYGNLDVPPCGVTHNKVDNNTWTVTITYSPLTCVTPANPTASAQSFCGSSTVANLQATGEAGATFKWFSAATDGTALPATTALASGTYYVSQVVDGCESERTSVGVTVTTVAAPTAEAQSFCPGATVANLTATGAAGATINWYHVPSGGTVLSSSTALTTSNYYVSQTVDDCESERTSVAVTVTDVAPPTASDQGVCPGSTVADLEATGAAAADFNWYTTATGGSALAENTALITGTYYVSQTVSGCESTREDVVVTVNATPAPDVDDEAVECYGTTVNDVAEGSDNFHIYTTETGGSSLAGDVLLTTATYYVSQTQNGCESARVSVDVTIIQLDEPVIANNQEFCSGATLSDIEVDYVEDADLEWYAEIGGDILPGSTLLTDGETYHCIQRFAECESDASEITVTVHATPDSPSGLDVQDFNSGDTIASFDITTEAAAIVTWYILDETSGYTVVGTDTELEDGAVYYCTQTVGGCESGFLTIEANELLSAETFGFKNLIAYPNPANELLNISNDEIIDRINVTNLLGQKVMSVEGGSVTMQINISQLPQGNYIVQVYSGNKSASLKIAKQ